jgi:hypothetical protein
MEEFLEEKPKQQANTIRGYRRLFLLVFSLALLWQVVGFIQVQLTQYHGALVNDFKMLLVVVDVPDNEALNTLGESLNSKDDITSVKLYSPQDALTALQAKNPRLTQALVALGREQMPAYFEIHLQSRAINNVESFVQNLAAEYPQLSVKYSPEMAEMIFYSGLCLRIVNVAALLALVLWVAFMFMIEAYPSRGANHNAGAVWVALLAGGLSFAILAVIVYPTGLLMPALENFTTIYLQMGLLVGCGLLGWTLSKWQKF